MKVDHQPETVDFTVATLDEPEAIAPSFHIFWGGKVGWFEPADDLPRYEKFRPIPAASKGRSLRPRAAPPATAGSGFAAPRQPSGRRAGRP
jgi:hypothetical protein